MSSSIVFCSGGIRSGKSAFALNLANRIPGPKLFVATAEAGDPEMAQRIKLHQKQRGADWHCLEVPMSQSCRVAELLPLASLPPSFRGDAGTPKAVLVDCLSTWASACQESWNGAPTELVGGVLGAFDDFLQALIKLDLPLFLVSAEVGLGLVPLDAETRQFCDLLGAVNQKTAKIADEVYFCISGLGIRAK